MTGKNNPREFVVVGAGPGGYAGAFLAADLALTIHPHPTLSETIMEAAEVFLGHSMHFYRPRNT
jgi:pyruvate/2-oxoglutarate dehydrogenase complex dihydrolipoamide dehydrogenase (E3) component